MRVLAKHPRLALVLAHMGAPEVEDFLALAEHYDNVRLDTTMVFTDFFPRRTRASCCRGCADLGHKILLGTDFPTIPYPYAPPAREPRPARPRRRLAARRSAGRTAPQLFGLAG